MGVFYHFTVNKSKAIRCSVEIVVQFEDIVRIIESWEVSLALLDYYSSIGVNCRNNEVPIDCHYRIYGHWISCSQRYEEDRPEEVELITIVSLGRKNRQKNIINDRRVEKPTRILLAILL